MDELIIARVVAGMGGGGFNTLATIVISDLVPLRQRGTWQGARNLVVGLGLGLGSLGGSLTEKIGWRWYVSGGELQWRISISPSGEGWLLDVDADFPGTGRF